MSNVCYVNSTRKVLLTAVVCFIGVIVNYYLFRQAYLDWELYKLHTEVNHVNLAYFSQKASLYLLLCLIFGIVEIGQLLILYTRLKNRND